LALPAGQRVNIVRRLRQRRIAVSDRFIEPAHAGVGNAPVGRNLRTVGIDLLRLGEVGERGIIPLHQSLQAASVVMVQVAALIIGDMLDRQVELIEGPRQFSPAHEDQAAVVVGTAVSRTQLQAQIVVGERTLVVALVAVGNAARVDDVDILGRDLVGGGERRDRAIVIALLHQAVAAIPEGGGPGRAGDLVVGDHALAGRQACDGLRR